jgi:hypothetical protein
MILGVKHWTLVSVFLSYPSFSLTNQKVVFSDKGISKFAFFIKNTEGSEAPEISSIADLS